MGDPSAMNEDDPPSVRLTEQWLTLCQKWRWSSV